MTTAATHPLAPEHLPRYIGSADGGDPLFTVVIWLLIIILLAVGNLYLKLHALPERMAHRQNSTQLQMIAVLAILALFTHNNVFWVAALLLAVVRFPDFTTPINSMADSLAELGKAQRQDTAAPEAPVPETETEQKD